MADSKKKTSVVVDFRALDDKALTEKLAELRKQLVEQYRSLAAGELANPALIRKTRKEIATAMTVAGENRRTAKETK